MRYGLSMLVKVSGFCELATGSKFKSIASQFYACSDMKQRSGDTLSTLEQASRTVVNSSSSDRKHQHSKVY